MALVGPGAVTQNEVEVKPQLEGASEYEYVTLLNPLTDDFVAAVAQDIPVNMPFEVRNGTGLVKDGGDITKAYGLDLKNPDHKALKHITNSIVIKAGQTINLKGDQAQVAVRQLVNEIAQREGKSRLLADPHVRSEIEARIIVGRGSVQELMDRGVQSPQAQINQAIQQSNEVKDEQAFPEFSETDQSRGTEAIKPASVAKSEPKAVGRPKKSNS